MPETESSAPAAPKPFKGMPRSTYRYLLIGMLVPLFVVLAITIYLVLLYIGDPNAMVDMPGKRHGYDSLPILNAVIVSGIVLLVFSAGTVWMARYFRPRD